MGRGIRHRARHLGAQGCTVTAKVQVNTVLIAEQVWRHDEFDDDPCHCALVPRQS